MSMKIGLMLYSSFGMVEKRKSTYLLLMCQLKPIKETGRPSKEQFFKMLPIRSLSYAIRVAIISIDFNVPTCLVELLRNQVQVSIETISGRLQAP